ncbi:hypothetical protein SEUCBS139899_008064 [Sporothrix eucalyptigena]|uniref:Arabinanase/levansucrase/invertase n=1 Tax=Sporothrix eucalyptigena TaxID=1812306 RepID=A0ABP0CEK9_9PEZI
MVASWSTLAVAAACLPSFVRASSAANTVTFSNNNEFLFDVDGNQIDAYAAKINYFTTSEGSQYYLYGISFAAPGSTGDGPLKSYSSVDLVNWKYNGILSETVAGGRPHMVYNAATQKYVLWVNVDGGYQVGTSSSPTGGFELVNGSGMAALDPSVAAAGLIGADHAVASFGDKAYLAYATLNFADPRAGSLWPPIFQTMHLTPLTADFTNTTLQGWNVTSPAFDALDQQTESPDIFERDGKMYIVTSNTCGFCDGSIGLVYRADTTTPDADTQWKRDIVSGYSCGGQVEGVFPLTDPENGNVTYIWHSTTVPGGPRVGFSGHIFQPLQFGDDGSVLDLNCNPKKQWDVPFTPGNVSASYTGNLTEATDASPRFANYQPVCDSNLYSALYQTWTNSKAGTLRSVSVNVAAGNNNANLTITVFAFSNISDLIAPSYKYTLLGSATFTPDQLTQVFGTATVSLNVTVAEGQMLGFAFGEAGASGSFSLGNFIPFCHLEYTFATCEQHQDGNNGQLLLQQGSGQNSFRGLKGNISPVTVRHGKGIKFFATVE